MKEESNNMAAASDEAVALAESQRRRVGLAAFALLALAAVAAAVLGTVEWGGHSKVGGLIGVRDGTDVLVVAS